MLLASLYVFGLTVVVKPLLLWPDAGRLLTVLLDLGPARHSAVF